MSATTIKARLERLECDGDMPGPIMILLYPGMTEAEAIAEHDRRFPGTRDPSHEIQFVEIRAVVPIVCLEGTIH